MNNALMKLDALSLDWKYWAGLLLLSLVMLATALYYQYALDHWPCVLCIQVRLWLSLLLLVSIVVLILRRHAVIRVSGNLLVVVTAAGLLERSYLLLGTERGFVFRSCGFDLGLPDWLALDTWFPWLFRVDASCGYTPELILGMTMAEMLILFSLVFLAFSFLVMAANLLSLKTRR